MIIASCLSRISAVGLLLVLGFVLAGERAHYAHAEGTAENVQEVDLARMALPLTAFGPGYASLQKDAFSHGFEPLAERDDREVNAYFSTYFDPQGDPFEGPTVGSAAGLFNSPTDAADFVRESIELFEDELAAGGFDVASFPVPGIDGATGVRASIAEPEFDLFFQLVVVIFPFDSLVGEAFFGRSDDLNMEPEAVSAAVALRDRMKGVMTGQVTDFPAPLPPDVNCDGSVDAIDASLVLQLDAGLADSLPCDALADANQDGSTDAIDASLILQYSAGLVDQLPV